MQKFKVTLLRVEPNSNPEEHIAIIEAGSERAVRNQAQKMLEHPSGRGWRSYGDPKLWGKVQKTIAKIEEVS